MRVAVQVRNIVKIFNKNIKRILLLRFGKKKSYSRPSLSLYPSETLNLNRSGRSNDM